MARRATIALDLDIDTSLRKLRARLIVLEDRNVTLKEILNLTLRYGIPELAQLIDTRESN